MSSRNYDSFFQRGEGGCGTSGFPINHRTLIKKKNNNNMCIDGGSGRI